MRSKVLKFRPVQSKRLFHPTRHYDKINWNDFSCAVREFKKQLYTWYIKPARVLMQKSSHYSFASLSLTCTLIDTLSQYEYGHKSSKKKLFIRFCRKHFPELKKRFSKPIPVKVGKKIRYLTDGSMALYHGIRCGILHEAHPSLFSAISGTGKIIEYHKTGLTEYSRNGQHFSSCPTAVFDPHRLLEETVLILRRYLNQLCNTNPYTSVINMPFPVFDV